MSGVSISPPGVATSAYLCHSCDSAGVCTTNATTPFHPSSFRILCIYIVLFRSSISWINLVCSMCARDRYVNGGPGALGGIFVHQKHHGDGTLVKLGGWWAQKISSRFAFPVVDRFDPVEGAAGWQASNPPPLLLAPLSAALEVWSQAGLERIAKKAKLLTMYDVV